MQKIFGFENPSRKKSKKSFRVDRDVKSPIISSDRRKTLLISEQSNYLFLKKVTTNNFPKKKYRALAPKDYSKFILHSDGISLSINQSLKYKYPESVLSNLEIDQLKLIKNTVFSELKSKCYKCLPSIRNFIYN
jgi:hypothetical protein